MNMSNIAGKKARIFTERCANDLAYEINEFLRTHKNVWDIQYQHAGTVAQGFKYSALIIYDPTAGDGKEQ